MGSPYSLDGTDSERPAGDFDAMAAEIARLRNRLLRQTNLVGAATGLLVAIARAGGYHIADTQHQQPIQAAMRALENAVTEEIAR